VRALRNVAVRLGPSQTTQLRGSMELSLRYRDSRILGEDVRPGLLPRLRRGPEPGERAPEFTFGTPGGRRRMHELLRGTRPVLLLFRGLARGPRAGSRMAGIAEEVRLRFGDEVAVLNIDAAMDADGKAHRHWGARDGAAYVVRPDGYVGYRCQPAEARSIVRYLDGILDGQASS
jgi:hypothetical protein